MGGGYKGGPESENKQLSNLALRWMAKKMPETLGLSASDFEEGVALGLMHDSRTGAARAYSLRVRRPPSGSRLHASVVDRIRGVVSPTAGDSNTRYRPPSLVHGGTQIDATPFRPAWDEPPGFRLTARYKVVDHDYETT